MQRFTENYLSAGGFSRLHALPPLLAAEYFCFYSELKREL